VSAVASSPRVRAAAGAALALLGATPALVLAGVVACSSSGPAVPAHPTWADDVRPILVANCVSCHNATTEEPSYDYPTLADFQAAQANFEFLISMGEGAIRRPALSSPMPPPPAAPLPDWQVETLVRWFDDPM
jgi:cytochrome c553